MPKDVLITPANGAIDFKDTSGAIDATIQLSDTGNLLISNPGGTLSIGNTAANLYVGDGINSVDVIFEQSGKIRALSNKTLTLGQSDSFVSMAAPTSFVSPDGSKTITARMLNTDVLSFQGGVGELLSLSDTMSGTLFSVNDVSGIPSIEVLDNGAVKLAQYSGNVLVGYATSNGNYKLQVNSQIFATSATIATSDQNYKLNVTPLNNALQLVNGLNPVSFNWKQHPVHDFDIRNTSIGFLAQEVQETLHNEPYVNSIVKESECTLPDGTKERFLGIAEGNMIAILTKAIQELSEKISAMESKIN